MQRADMQILQLAGVLASFLLLCPFSVAAIFTALIDESGPSGALAFTKALQDDRVEQIWLETDVQLPRHIENTPIYIINRNLTIRSSAAGFKELDFNFAAGCALICPTCTITFQDVTIANAQRVQALTFFKGDPGSKVVFRNVQLKQLVCPPVAAGQSILRDAPRSRAFSASPGASPRQLVLSVDAQYRGGSYPGSIHAADVAVDLPVELLERETFIGGYSLLYNNVTQLCFTPVDEACLSRSSLVLCTEEKIRQLESGTAASGGSPDSQAATPADPSSQPSFTAGAVAGAVIGAVAGTTVLLAACALAVHALRKARKRGRRQEGVLPSTSGSTPPSDSWMFISPQLPNRPSQEDGRQRKLDWRGGPQTPPSSGGSNEGAAGGGGGGGGAGGGSAAPPELQGRAKRLTAAIASKVFNIHEQRLSAAVGGDSPSPGLRRGLSGGAASDTVPADDVEAMMGVMRQTADNSQGGSCFEGEAEDADEDDLQIVKVIGRGGFGTVYKATWHGTAVAVKVVELPPGSKAVAASVSSFTTKRPDGSMLWGLAGHKEQAWRSPLGAGSAIEDMAVQEAAIGSSITHPNIVSVYQVLLKPIQHYKLRVLQPTAPPELTEEAAGAGRGSSSSSSGSDSTSGSNSGGACGSSAAVAGDSAAVPPDLDLVPWEMQLIMEYCDQGTLRDVLDAQLIFDRSTKTNHIPTVLSLAQQVARAMQYLHKEHILHGDLKASNVLLQSAVQFASFTGSSMPSILASADSTAQQDELQAALPGCDLQWLPLKGCTVTAKVSDFGLSTSLDPPNTHVTRRGPGTLTHTAPETLVHGHCSRASDVYAYGMLLYELATGNRVYSGMPQMLVGQLIVEQQLRPKWPASLTGNPCWSGLIQLTEICWAQNPHVRPTFSEILAELRQLARGNRVSIAITDRLNRAATAAAAETPPVAPEWRQETSNSSSSNWHVVHAPASSSTPGSGPWPDQAMPLLQQQSELPDSAALLEMVLQTMDSVIDSVHTTTDTPGIAAAATAAESAGAANGAAIAGGGGGLADGGSLLNGHAGLLLHQHINDSSNACPDAATTGIVLQPLDGTSDDLGGGAVQSNAEMLMD